MEQGPVERQIIKDAARMRMPLPDKIKNAPNLLPGLELYFIGYEELVAFRTAHTDRSALVWADVHEYAKHFNFSDDQRTDFMHYAREMERAFVMWQRKKQGKGGNGGRTNPKATFAAHSKTKQADRTKR